RRVRAEDRRRFRSMRTSGECATPQTVPAVVFQQPANASGFPLQMMTMRLDIDHITVLLPTMIATPA
ncbi:MAG: hypothetical protein RKL32_13500, partial [Gammaproteobacteria bacterium]